MYCFSCRTPEPPPARPTERQAARDINRQINWFHQKIFHYYDRKQKKKRRKNPSALRHTFFTVEEMAYLCGYMKPDQLRRRMYRTPWAPFPIRHKLVRRKLHGWRAVFPKSRVRKYLRRVIEEGWPERARAAAYRRQPAIEWASDLLASVALAPRAKHEPTRPDFVPRSEAR